MRRYFVAFFVLWAPFSLYAEGEHEKPYFAGTLLEIYPTNVEPGHISVQPFLFLLSRYGHYNRDGALVHDIRSFEYDFLLSIETGITKWLDIGVLFRASYARSHFGDFWTAGDTGPFVGIVLWNEKEDRWVTDLRIVLYESMPTGIHDRLDFDWRGNDATGSGAYETWFIVVARKILYTRSKNPLNWNLNLIYAVSEPTTVHDFSIYGGALGTHGTVFPGDRFITNLSFEYDFTKNWGIGIDLRYEFQSRSQFFPRSSGPLANTPISARFSIAPCLEYNFSETMSLTWGAWFSTYGRNIDAFAGGGATFFYYY